MIKEEVIKELRKASDSSAYLYGTANCFDVFFANIFIEAAAGFNLYERYGDLYLFFNWARSWVLSKRYSKIPVAGIVMIPAAKNHLDQMLPVARHLVITGHSILFLVNRIELLKTLIRQGFPVYWIHEPLWSYKKTTAPTTILNGFPGSYLKKRWNNWISKIETYTRAYNYIFQKVKPCVALIGYDITFEGRLACRFFADKQIPTVCIQHGDMSGILNSEHIADEFYVYGEAVKEHLQTINRNPGTRFIVTGAPYLDGILSHPRNVVIPGKLKLPRGNKYVLVAFSGPGNNTSLIHHRQLIEAIFKLSGDLESTNIVIKLHPKDRKNYYANFPVKLGKGSTLSLADNSTFQDQLSIYDWLNACDLMITGGSTTALEAMLIDVPVISLDLQDEYRQVSFVSHGAVRYIRNEAEFIRAARKILNDPVERSKVIDNQREHRSKFFKLDGSSTARCVDEIRKHLN